jgi:hypothetical protein
MQIVRSLFFVTLAFFALNTLAQDTLHYPVDIIYHEATQNYYVSNSANGSGYILKLDSDGNILETFYSGLHYTGGMCLVDGILYVGDNYGLWEDDQPSRLIGIDLATGNEVLNFLVASEDSYIDLMTTDNNGYLYIGNSANGLNNGKVHKFDIANQILTELVFPTPRPFGITYDFINDQLVFVESGPSISFLKTVSTEGGTVNKVFYMNRRMNGVIMKENGDFFISSWGEDNNFGDESVYKVNIALNWHIEISTGHNRPFGMCIGKDNHLAVCNWGEHSLSFIDLDPFGINESHIAQKTMRLFPNPGNGHFSIRIDDVPDKSLSLAVFDLQGKEIYNEQVRVTNILFEKNLNLDFLTPGTYVIRILSDSFVSQEKLIIR